MRIELRFLAAIPVGHEVVIQQLERDGFFGGREDADAIVLDRGTGIVWGPFVEASTLTAETFSTAALGSLRRKLGSDAIEGRVVGCFVSTKGYGEHNHITTVLHLAPVEANAYR